MSLAERFFNIYGGLDRARGKSKVTAKVSKNGKRDSSNQTLREPYDVRCWDHHLNGEEGLGVIPITDNATCNWGAIDVDVYPLDLVELEAKVNGLELPFVVLRTKSGGAHLTAYFKEFQSCAEVRAKMAEASFALGLGEREFYPKQVKLANSSDIGNWLNMPYFQGALTERYAIIAGKPATPEQFLNYVESIRLDDIISFEVPETMSEFSDGPPCLQAITSSKAGEGERNTVLFNIGVYCRAKFESSWEDKLSEFNHQFVSPPLNHREVTAIVKSLEKKNYAYTCNNVPLCNNCNRETCKGRDYGIHAFQHIDVGIALDSITKMNSEPPMWILSIEGVRTEVETEDILSQERFKIVCVNTINKIPGKMKAEEWDKFMRIKLSSIEIIDVPKETRLSDRITDHLTRYFATTPPARSPTDINIGRWVEEPDGYYTRGSDFMDYLRRQNIEFDARKVWVLMMDLGVKPIYYRKNECWIVPKEVYDPNGKEKKLPLPPKDIKHEDF
jgi:hypothetical protein